MGPVSHCGDARADCFAVPYFYNVCSLRHNLCYFCDICRIYVLIVVLLQALGMCVAWKSNMSNVTLSTFENAQQGFFHCSIDSQKILVIYLKFQSKCFY